MNANFEKLIQRQGTYSLPYLIHLYDKDKSIELFLVNNNENVIYKNKTYIASSFKYDFNQEEYGFNGGGNLEISLKENNLIELIENYRDVYLDVIGAINDDGVIEEIKTIKNHYGKIKATREKATFTFEKDDRLTMTFPTLIWNSQNNRGNT